MHRICKDCPPESKRPSPYAGPRCATHHRGVMKARRAAAHESKVQKVYGLAPGDYDRLYQLQGGCCYICQRSTGKTKKLSVDHDHATGLPRGLLCTICNRMLGWLRDSPEAWLRGFSYLKDPPARSL